MVLQTPSPRIAMWWKAHAVFTSLVTIGIAWLLLALPQTGGDTMPTSLIFTFFPVFYFLDGLRLFQLQDYGMGSLGMLVTIPVGILWTVCVISLTLFGKGKWNALSNPTYARVRKVVIFVGTSYLALCLGMLVDIFIFAKWRI